jgi:hypothetical protein
MIYLSLSAGMLIYAVPHLEMEQEWTLPTVFGIVWLSILIIIIAAQLFQFIGVDEETRNRGLRSINIGRRNNGSLEK